MTGDEFAQATIDTLYKNVGSRSQLITGITALVEEQLGHTRLSGVPAPEPYVPAPVVIPATPPFDPDIDP